MKYELPETDNSSSHPEEASDANNDIREITWQRLKNRVGTWFDGADSGEQRISNVKDLIRPFIQFLNRDENDIFSDLDQCTNIEDKDTFTERISRIIEPLVDAKLNDTEAFEKVMREEFIKNSDFTRVNDLFAYGIHGNTLHLHVPPNESTPLRDKLRLIREGMKQIADIVKDNPEVTQVTGASWIVAEHPDLLKRLGFTLKGEISGDMRDAHFAGDDRAIHEAVISRDDLLNKYS